MAIMVVLTRKELRLSHLKRIQSAAATKNIFEIIQMNLPNATKKIEADPGHFEAFVMSPATYMDVKEWASKFNFAVVLVAEDLPEGFGDTVYVANAQTLGKVLQKAINDTIKKRTKKK